MLNPDEAQKKLTNIAEKTVKWYISELGYKISRVGTDYNIPKAEWNNYLSGIAFNVPSGDVNSTTNLAEITAVTTYPLISTTIVVPALTKGTFAVVIAVQKTAAALGIKLAGKFGAGGAAAVVGEIADPLEFLLGIYKITTIQHR